MHREIDSTCQQMAQKADMSFFCNEWSGVADSVLSGSAKFKALKSEPIQSTAVEILAELDH